MYEVYRGHRIQLSCARYWDAVIVHAESGAVFPTKATALLREGRTVAIHRARALVDIYLDAGEVQAFFAA